HCAAIGFQTYRRYIQPLTLLELLIDRFNVPEPDFAEAAEQASVAAGEIDSPITIAVRLEKRFRSMYKRRVQYRVLNFLIKWVKDPSFYKLDILPNQPLRERLWEFLDSVDARNLANNVANIRKSLRGDRIRLRQTIEQLPPEPLDLGLVTCPEDVKLANVHPLELARQITLHEWELYSRIEFWEVNGHEKVKGPNLQASLDFSNKALISKAKSHHRTFFEALRRAVETDDGDTYVADYERKLREVNPPGLPFIAVGGKTHLIHLELKHSDWITVPNNTMAAPSNDGTWTDEQGTVSLVNFWKCHQLADLVEYYLSFQHTPYNFVPNEHIRERRLTLAEQRIASLLNTTPPDHRLTVDSREFRAALHYASAVPMVTTCVDQATTTTSAISRPVMGPASPPVDMFPLPPATGSLGRGGSRVPDATRSYRGPNSTSGRMQSALGGFQSHPHSASQQPTTGVVVPTHNDAFPENSILMHRRISSVVPDSQKSAPCLPPRPTRLRSSLPQPNDVPSSGVECDVTVGHNTRRLTASVSPSFLSGLTSSPPVVGSPQISKSTGPHEDPLRDTADCPPSLPPRRVHSRAHSSVPLPIHSSCSLTSASRESSVQPSAIGLQSLDQTSPGCLPPPLPPKRQWNRSGV
ncbi:son of sevenless, partial [Paragonimus westermani]